MCVVKVSTVVVNVACTAALAGGARARAVGRVCPGRRELGSVRRERPAKSAVCIAVYRHPFREV